MDSIKKISEEIKKAYPYRIELHAHSQPVSKCANFPTEEVLKTFRDDGYDGIAITNHFMTHDNKPKEEHAAFYQRELYKAYDLAEKIGIKMYAGAELRFKFVNDNDYLLFGYNPDDIFYICQLLETDLETFVKSYKTDDMFLLQAHPFRDNMVRADTDLLDGIEGFNLHPNHNSRVAVSVNFANEHNKIITMGTDYHHLNHDNLCATRMSILPANEKELVRVLKSDDFVYEIGDKIII